MAEQKIRTIYEMILERNGAKQVEDSLKRQQGVLRATKKDAASVSGELKKLAKQEAFSELAKDAAKLVREGEDADKVIRRLDISLKKLGANEGEIANVARQFQSMQGGGSRAQRGQVLRTVGREIRQLPSQQIPGLGIGTDTIGNLARSLGGLGVSVTTLATTILPVVAVIAGLVATFKLVSSAAEEARKAQRLYIDALLETEKLLAGGATSEELKEQIRLLEEDSAARREAIAEAHGLNKFA